MKLGVVGDIHWSKYSSIVRQRGNKYSVRLENCIKSINWAEDTLRDCDKIIYLGDFFDSDNLKSEEITALSEVQWNDKEHLFLVGNHEIGLNDLSFSSAHLFNIANKLVIDKPYSFYVDDTELCFIPYILDNSGDITDYIPLKENTKKRIIFSHNDLAGIQLGKFLTTAGFDINIIKQNCDLFINGHLHNESSIEGKIYNIGNLTGQNFSEDGTKYGHNIFILDTNTLSIQKVKNPYAINFFKFDTLEELLKYDLPINSVVTAKLYTSQINKCESIKTNENVIAHRFIILSDSKNYSRDEESTVKLSVNHLEKFQEFIIDRLGNDPIVVEELSEVLS